MERFYESLASTDAERHLGARGSTNRITEIINGQRAITGDTALRLAHFFGTTAEFWLNLPVDLRFAASGGVVFAALVVPDY